ncbi:hypothetical protein KC878_01745 [Candidatus Saccharibacteria bacterium]|nr:hypothetical protein [Candidatus Saccharibacteria bacterium]MCB9821696.1 hypothetical protein [Candidatus Nomurabacteria bacterium]
MKAKKQPAYDGELVIIVVINLIATAIVFAAMAIANQFAQIFRRTR